MEQQFIIDFHHGIAARSYQVLGCHLLKNEKNTAVFRVYAPRAQHVFVIGDFNNWNETHEMKRITNEGLYEVYVDDVFEYQNYKYLIKTADQTLYKIDPYGYHHEIKGAFASKVFDVDKYQWHDQKYLENKQNYNSLNSPVNIYEVHLGSWRRYHDGNYFDYKKLALELIPYCKKMGYTHIETMPITEYPYDPSWGYQVTGYYAVTSRYGTPDGFQFFVDYAHKHGIGVIIDWVPAHFPKDSYGLYEFDGGPLYEYDDPLKRDHLQWGTRIFNYEKPEVKSFLISSAMFFFDKYHVDGIRVDAVASMLYLDYCKTEFRPNKDGGNYNLEAIEFLKGLNYNVFNSYPYAMMIAEESSSFPGVTKPVYSDGLGFNYKWNMGWMNDTLRYIKEDPINRKYHHNKINFSMMYAYSENFILPLSHDEVVHLKGSILNKMPGSYDNKFSNVRAYITYMMTHPGKKLNFMGYEIGQFNEWNFDTELTWSVLNYPRHVELQKYIMDLNKLYLKNPCLWQLDTSWDGFKWINADDSDYNIISYRRIDEKGKELVVVINFSGDSHHYYRIGVPKGTYKEIFNSDLNCYGGTGFVNEPVLETEKIAYNGMDDSLVIRIPALSAVIFKRVKKSISKSKENTDK